MNMRRAEDIQHRGSGRRLLVLGSLCLMLTSVVADFELVILHTNDVHARVEQSNTYHARCSDEDAAANKCFGGVARRMTVIDEVRRNYSNVLLLDAGDVFQGTVWFSHYGGLEGSHFMNRLRYDAMALGNHEFDNGPEGLDPFLKNASFPVLSANLDISREPYLWNVNASTILTRGGQKIGIVGYITQETSFLVNPDTIRKVGFEDEVLSVQKEVEALKKSGVNKIIALGHAGFEMDVMIAKEVKDIDIVIGGHTNTFLYTGVPPSGEKAEGKYPTVVSQTPDKEVLVVQDYGYGKYLGFLRVTFDDGGSVKDYSGNPILLDGSIAEDAEIKKEVEEWETPLVSYRTTVVGTSYVLLQGGKPPCQVGECSIGNLITDAIVYGELIRPSATGWAAIAVAVWNGGGMRTSINQGNITLADILGAFPFRNEVMAVQLTGTVIREMLEHSVAGIKEVKGQFLQMSGMQVAYNIKKPVGQRVVEVSVQCAQCEVPKYEPLVDDQTYGMYINTFLFDGGDGYNMIPEHHNKQEQYFGTLADDVIADYINKRSPITIGLQGRIRFVDDPPPPPICPTSGAVHGVGISTMMWLASMLLIL